MLHHSLKLPIILILTGASLLLSLSLLSLRSVAPETFSTQVSFIVVGLALAFGLSRLDYHLYTFSPWPWYGLTLFLLLITALFGDHIRGAVRWLNLFGLSLQTSEIAKPFFILFLAIFVSRHYPQNFKALILFFGLLCLPVIFIFLQPDLGTAIIFGLIIVTGLTASGIKFSHLALLFLGLTLCLPLLFPFLKSYQRDRLTTFINRSHDALGIGYNARQSQIAIGSGQILGRGLGQGTQSHLRFLPERHTDFIFASIVEELGFLGGLLILLAYTLLAVGLLQAARYAFNEVGSLICLVSLAVILLQAFINLGMNLGLLPVTGVTLPLVSAGGSSLISLSLILGICLSIASRPSPRQRVLQIR